VELENAMKSPLNRLFLATMTASMACYGLVPVTEGSAEENKEAVKITFDEHVAPILRAKCGACHNTSKKSGDLDMSNYTNLMQGGGSGDVIEPGSADDSYLYMLVTHESEPFMPPKSDKLPEESLNIIRDWIDGGAPENAGSAPLVSKKPKVNLVMTDPGTRPEVAPLPGRLSLEPWSYTARTGAVTAMATSPWAPLVAIASPKQVLLYNTQTLQLAGTFSFEEGVVEVLNFSRNGSLLLAGGGRAGATGKVVVWSIDSGERIIEVGDEFDSVLGADISSDHSLIALGSAGKVIRVYSTASGELEYEIPKKHTEWIYCVAFSPDGVLLATADRNGGLFIWEAENGREYLKLGGHGGAITGLSWRNDSNILGSCSEDGSIKLWEMENGGQVKNWGAHGGGVASMEFARDGRILSCGRDKVTKLWDQNGSQQRAFEGFGDIALQASFCDETNRAISGDWTGDIRIWNAEDGARLANLSPNPPHLKDRLETAVTQHAEAEATYKPLAETSTASTELAKKAEAELIAANKAVVDTRTVAETTATRLETAKKSVAEITTRYDAAKAIVTALEPVVPLLKESLAKAQGAAEKAKEDKELAEIAAKLLAATNTRAATLSDGQKAMAAEAKLLETAKTVLAAADKAAKEADIAYKDAQALQVKADAAVKPAVEKAAVDLKAATDAQQVVATTSELAKKWQDEIQFVDQLNTLLGQRDTALEALEAGQQVQADKQVEVNAAKAEYDTAAAALASAQKATQNAQAQYDALLATVETSKKAQATAEGNHQAAIKAATTLEAAIKSLAVAVTSAKEAAAQSAEDKDLAAAAESLAALVEKKEAEIVELQKDVVAKLAVVETSKATVVENQKQAAAANVVLLDAGKQAEERAAALKPFEAKLAEMNKQSEAVAQTVSDAEKVVDGFEQQLSSIRHPEKPEATPAS
jgi:hypothetical protein